MKIAIVLGSIRDGRLGEGVAQWVAEHAQGRKATYEIVDLKEFDVPLLTTHTHPMAANKHYDDPRVQAWGDVIGSYDAYVFVSAEYNHGVPGAFKNAVDSLGQEWVGKALALVAYGSVGGVRAAEQWRTIMANFSMVDVRAEVNLNSFTDFTDGQPTPPEAKQKSLQDVFDQLEKMTAQLAT